MKKVIDGKRYEALSKLYMIELEYYCCFVYYTYFHCHSLRPAFITSPTFIVCIYNSEIIRSFLTYLSTCFISYSTENNLFLNYIPIVYRSNN